VGNVCDRLTGELFLQPRARDSESEAEKRAEDYLREAVESARRQNAKSLELRAAMSVSRLWQQQGKKSKARQLLAKTYSWFSKGFATVDLQGAKSLLEKLSSMRIRHMALLVSPPYEIHLKKIRWTERPVSSL
jgi:predicted ATPase